MESKGLNIKSFYRNQKLLDAINLLLIHFKLSSVNIQSKIEEDKIEPAKGYLLSFLDQLENLVIKVEKREDEPLVGTDIRLRTFAKSFVEARGRKTKFRSPLFQSSIPAIHTMIQNNRPEDSTELIQSLTELRVLLEEQISIDSKSIINEI
jgi:hypothetical protein